MRVRSEGWRSARWRDGGSQPHVGVLEQPSLAGGAAAGTLPGPWPARSRGKAAVAEPAPAGTLPRIEDRFRWPWQGVEWSLGYVAFLGYVFVISSYVVNAGQLLMLTALLGVTLGSRERWRLPAAMGMFLLFIIEVGLTYKVTEYRYYDTKPLQDLVKVFLIALVSVNVLNSRARIRFFMFFYLGTFALFPVRGGVFNWFFYRATTQGRVAWNHIFENPNDFAALMIFPLGLCLAFLVAERLRTLRVLSFIGLAVIPMVVFMTQSRGAILALGGGALTYFALQGRGRLKAFLGFAAIAVVVATFAPSDVWSRLSSLKSASSSGKLEEANDRRSAEQRLEIWKVAWSVHEAFPITGVGWAGYPNAHMAFARRTGFDRIASGARDTHNTYLTVLAETGWIGLGLWLTLIGLVVSKALRAMRRVRSYAAEYAMQLKMLLLSLLSYGACAVFGSFAHMSFTYLHLTTILALATVTLQEVDAFERGPVRRRSA